jgi:hypothetical protein
MSSSATIADLERRGWMRFPALPPAKLWVPPDTAGLRILDEADALADVSELLYGGKVRKR